MGEADFTLLIQVPAISSLGVPSAGHFGQVVLRKAMQSTSTLQSTTIAD
ncbi:hypothetical protein HALOI3_60057 [Halomonas sp. I3]|nr:hypothetical protein HALOI3_60057 [Halomonas sp. I3]